MHLETDKRGRCRLRGGISASPLFHRGVLRLAICYLIIAAIRNFGLRCPLWQPSALDKNKYETTSQQVRRDNRSTFQNAIDNYSISNAFCACSPPPLTGRGLPYEQPAATSKKRQRLAGKLCCKCSLPVGRIRHFGSEDKLRELIVRTPTRFDLAGKQALDHAFQGGHGGVYLELTAEQYMKLKR